MHDGMTIPILLKELHLRTMLELWESILEGAHNNNWSHSKFLSAMCEVELEARHRKKIQATLKKSNLPPGKSLACFDFAALPSVDKKVIDDIANDSGWVRNAENILIFGPSGVGKSHLAAAIGYAMIEQNIKVLYIATTKLVQQLQAACRECTLPAALAKLDKYEVVILDDIGYVRKDEAETHVLFELIAHRYESGSIVLTSNQPFSEWDNIFATNSMTVAAVDRLVHHARIIEIKANSYRQKQALDKKSNK